MSEQKRIDCLAFAQDSGMLCGIVAVQDLPRLRSSLACHDGDLDYRMEAGRENAGRTYMRLEVKGRLSLQCQRCMQVFIWPLAIESRVWIARHQSELEAWDLQADGLEDAILAEQEFDWLAWLEDEVMLALPIAPLHPADICPQSGQQESIPHRPHPFAGLAVLKKQILKS